MIVDELEAALQPHCPNDDTVLREVSGGGGWYCGNCNYKAYPQGDQDGPVIWQPEFKGPSFPGF